MLPNVSQPNAVVDGKEIDGKGVYETIFVSDIRNPTHGAARISKASNELHAKGYDVLNITPLIGTQRSTLGYYITAKRR